MQHIIEITDGVPRHPLYRMNHPVNLAIASGEQVAIVGANGSGKSRLVDIITGRYPLLLNEVRYDFSPSPLKLVSENIKYITFRDSYGDSDGSYYYQQRWNQQHRREDPDRRTNVGGGFHRSRKHYGVRHGRRGKATDARAAHDVAGQTL